MLYHNSCNITHLVNVRTILPSTYGGLAGWLACEVWWHVVTSLYLVNVRGVLCRQCVAFGWLVGLWSVVVTCCDIASRPQLRPKPSKRHLWTHLCANLFVKEFFFGWGTIFAEKLIFQALSEEQATVAERRRVSAKEAAGLPTLNTAWEGWSPMLERRRLSVISKRGSRTPNGKITAWEGKSPVLEIGKVGWKGKLVSGAGR